jgi:hypothetical protein
VSDKRIFARKIVEHFDALAAHSHPIVRHDLKKVDVGSLVLGAEF